jgi:diguanylate cyclase (GGDEF)-like protein
LWRNQAPINWGIGPLATFSIMLAFTFSGLNAIIGLNKIMWSRATVADAMALSLSCWVVTLFLLILDYLQIIFRRFPVEPLPILMLFTIGLVAQFFFVAVRFRLRLITAVANRWLSWRKDYMKIGERVLIVGAGEAFHTANWMLRRGEYQFVFSIVGVVGDEIVAEHGMRIDGCLVLGSLAELPELVKKKEIGVIVFTIPHIPTNIKEFVFDMYEKSGVKLIFLHNLTQIVTRQLTLPVRRTEFTRWSENYLGYLDLHDSVTGLPNRYLFEDRLLHSVALSHRYKITPTVLFIEIIGFRETDVRLEIKELDRCIIQISERLRRQKREGDTLAFVGEDRFAFILENIGDEGVIPSIAKRLYASLIQPFLLDGKNLHIRASISVCTDVDHFGEGPAGSRDRDILKTLVGKSVLISEI